MVIVTQPDSACAQIATDGKKIDLVKFKLLLEETRQLYLSLYSWYYMPSSLHKVLMHGCDIIDFFDLPIELLSEEALEATHKNIRNSRLYHTRKTNRIHTNLDLIKYLLLNSDPSVSKHRKTASKQLHANLTDTKAFMVDDAAPSFTQSDLNIFFLEDLELHE
ncbi:unnamed protein product [Psylliodes chrysocephalus]|uniref:Uncharacterized protein n=1 Tax=Psylliodes chrysocephalus TaxID=3402493 RepID=A0A9P0CT85_9CUCU|nr:unnamed protein product [Psylliodes chrysocephala]